MKIVVIRIDCLGQYFVTRAVAHVYLRQVFLTKRRERSGGYCNRLLARAILSLLTAVTVSCAWGAFALRPRKLLRRAAQQKAK